MFPKYLFLLLSARICWSYLVWQSEVPDEPRVTFDPNQVGKPLILTGYIKSNHTEARRLSAVEALDGSNIVSNSGFLTVNETSASYLFFWFFRQNSTTWQKAPLVLWLQGGPGCSSMQGLFEENGPYTVTKSGLKLRDHSWTKDYNMLYIDQPVGSGFSFTNSSDGYVKNQEQVAEHLYEALAQFFQLYPELSETAFYISGESYAGRYIPAISYKIHTLRKANQSDINLRGLFMISPMINLLLNGLSNFCFEVGIIDSETKSNFQSGEKNIESHVHSGNGRLTFFRREFFFSTLKSISNATLYDYTKSFEDGEKYIKFLQGAANRKKIHAGDAEFSGCPQKLVFTHLLEDSVKSIVPWIEELIENYPVAFVSGQYDVTVAYPLVREVMWKLNWNGAFNYSTARRHQFFSGGDVAGYYKSAGNLKDVLIRRAGHMVPKDQPKATLELLNKFVKGEL